MERLRFPLIALTLLLILPLSRTEAQFALSDSVRIIVLGSSTASARGASKADSGWVWRYAAFLKSQNPRNEVINLAAGGYTTYHIQPSEFKQPDGRPAPDSSRNITAAIALRPSAIIINLPSNDAAQNIRLEERAENLVRVADRAARAGIPLWVCSAQPRNRYDQSRGDLIAMREWIFKAFQGNALDFWSVIATADGKIRPAFDAGDGVHLNDAGHRVLFETVRDARIPEQLQLSRLAPKVFARNRVELLVFPAPATDFVTFRIRTLHRGGYTLIISDLLGKEIHRRKEDVPTGVVLRYLPTGKFHRGVYRVLLENGPTVISSKLVLTR